MKIKNFLLQIIMVVAVSMPFANFALAQPVVNVNYNTSNNTNGCPADIGSVADIFDLAVCILKKSVWPLLISISVIVFIVGVIKYISKGDDSSAREEGTNLIIYGLVGLFVIVSVWGLVGVLQGTFGIGNTTFIPQLQESQ
ncbi:MAG: hypothetical protein R3B39_02235 [Candidatus Paceibacterota bacterium]